MSKSFTRCGLALAALALTGLAIAVNGCGGGNGGGTFTVTRTFKQANLVSDLASFLGVSPTNVDPNLINPWGIAFAATGPFWISDNGTGKSTIYDSTANFAPASLVVTIAPPAGGAGPAAPNGIVFNSFAPDFTVPGTNAAALFIFSTEDGTLSAWNQAAGSSSVLVVDNSNAPAGVGSVYKGLTIGTNSTGQNLLYATNFRTGNVEVYDKTFTQVATFTDPNVPAGFAPFGIANIPGVGLLVSFARQDAKKHDDVDIQGQNNGVVDVFTTDGKFVRTLASGGTLMSPWGMTPAPAGFLGNQNGALLVGNFGDGRINVFNPNNNQFLSQLTDANKNPISIEGLWGLTFGNGGKGGNANTLYFTAGISDGVNHATREGHGLFGSLSPN